MPLEPNTVPFIQVLVGNKYADHLPQGISGFTEKRVTCLVLQIKNSTSNT
jgi:hypothetical protein